MHVCLFDIDGTLLRTAGAGMAALASALLDEFGVADVSEVQTSGRTDRGIVRDVFERHEIPHSQENWLRWRAAYLQRLMAALATRPGEVLPGVVDLLARLAARKDVAIGLLTGNLREGARIKLAHYGLDHFFSFGAYGDEHFDRDDIAREALALVRQRFEGRVGCHDVWVIGDTPLDVQCARAIGARCVGVTTGLYRRDELVAAAPDLLLDSLTEAVAAWSVCLARA
jgi:phosphoglycolate phosphatase-like HAD superfamily hydrolase